MNGKLRGHNGTCPCATSVRLKELRKTLRYLTMLADQHVEIRTRILQNRCYPLARVFR